MCSPTVIRGGCFRFRDVQLRAFGRLPEQGNGETTARCHRRDINLTANNALLILPHATSSMLFRVFISIVSDGMKNLNRTEYGSDVQIEQIVGNELQNNNSRKGLLSRKKCNYYIIISYSCYIVM